MQGQKLITEVRNGGAEPLNVDNPTKSEETSLGQVSALSPPDLKPRGASSSLMLHITPQIFLPAL